MEIRTGPILAFLAALCVVGGAMYAILDRGSSIVAGVPPESPPPLSPRRSVPTDTSPPAAAATLPPGMVFKCDVHGAVTYSDRPCPGARLVDARPALEGYQPTVTPRSQQRAVDRSDRQDETRPAVATAPDTSGRCAYIDERIKQIDEYARRGGNAQFQDGLREERRKLVDERYALKC